MNGVRFSGSALLAALLAAAPVTGQTGAAGDTVANAAQHLPMLAYARIRLPESVLTPASAVAPVYDPGSTPLAFGETLLGNFVPWLFNEYVTRYKDITRISPTSWKSNVADGFRWDDNHFHVNMLMHPYAGSLYFAAGRSNDFNFEKSFLFSVFGSALWECCGENHHPSGGDLLSTTIGGTALGEMLFRWTSQMLNYANTQTPRNGWWEVPVAVLSPTRTFTRWTLGRFSAPNPPYVGPGSWALFTTTGWQVGKGAYFHETGYTYGDVIAVSRRSRPFTHFETAVELDFGAVKQTIGRIQARGSLWSFRGASVVGPCLTTSGSSGMPGVSGLSNCNTSYFNIIPYLGFDYVNNDAYEFGGQSIGLAGFYTVGQYPGGPHGVIALDGHGLFGAVQSEYAYLGQIHDPDSERPREYDFTIGTGFGAAAIGSWHCLRVSGFARLNRHKVVNGSSEAGPAFHRTRLLGIRGRCRLAGILGVGADYRHYHRKSSFSSSLAMPHVVMNDGRFRLFLTLDAVRPLGLFVF